MVAVPPTDRAALSDLVARYASYVDGRDLDAVAELFTDDGVLVLPDLPASLAPSVTHEGRAGVRAALAAVAGVPQTFHAIVGEVYDAGPSDDIHRGTVACAAHHLDRRGSGEITDRVWHLRYRDTYRRTGEGWRIARRELHLASIESRPVRSWAVGAGGA
ncbi:SnoaL-like domain-containing protein [Blastococcus sp. DSM 46786]|uniref:nuclear transport factor 2 family protein n=1 Tax=Blastococcus sp. DSM 46786 TaxID=1798227 RepID=UPI0008C571AF|nr:nuclear transport factor 2 family protein [Blastococcus sp. DSM 46786]SEK73032.1 SnoaL-like domain-containing protein [Blastococcus sp. DSM 46786]